MWDDKKGRLYHLKRAMQCQAETEKKKSHVCGETDGKKSV